MTEPKKEKERDTSLNLYQRMMIAWNALEAVKKKKSGGSDKFSYQFVGHAEASEHIRKVLFENGILVFPSTVERIDKMVKITTHKGQEEKMLTSLRVSVSFVNIDKPEERESVEVWGDGLGNDDKNPGKALSYAVKYALMKTSLLPTKDMDDIENHSNTYQSSPSYPSASSHRPSGGGGLDFDAMKADLLAQPTLEALDKKGKEYRDQLNNESKSDKQKYAGNDKLNKAYKERKEALQDSQPCVDLPTQAEFDANDDKPAY